MAAAASRSDSAPVAIPLGCGAIIARESDQPKDVVRVEGKANSLIAILARIRAVHFAANTRSMGWTG